MRWLGLVSLLFIFIFAGILSVREYFLIQEINAIQLELSEKMESDFQNAFDLERVLDLSASEQVFQRYLSPAFKRIQNLSFPPSRSGMSTEWERKVHLKIDDLVYRKTGSLASEIQQELSSLRLSSEAGIDRLMRIVQISSKLPRQEERVKLVTTEIEEIQNKSQQEDQIVLNRLKSSGRDRLQSLSSEISKMSEADFIQFLTSERYRKEFQQPIIEDIMKLNRESLRIATWNEYSDQVQSRLQRKNRQLVQEIIQNESEKSGLLPVESKSQDNLSNLLKTEYERLKDEEKQASKFPLPSSPSADILPRSLGTN